MDCVVLLLTAGVGTNSASRVLLNERTKNRPDPRHRAVESANLVRGLHNCFIHSGANPLVADHCQEVETEISNRESALESH